MVYNFKGYNFVKKIITFFMLKIKLNNNDLWVTSDTHYSHKNICRGVTEWRLPNGEIPINETRDFNDINEMNDHIVNNINNMIKPNDVLLHLGDWSFGGFDNIVQFRERINCKNIHLILGNHDHHILNNKNNVRDLFTTVHEIVTIEVSKDKKRQICRCSHEPIQSWDGLNKGHFHLHGHVHLPYDKKFGKGKKMDCGIDGSIDYKPYNFFGEIVPLLSKREIFSDMLFDHHVDEMKGIVG